VSDRDDLLWFSDRVRIRASDCVWGLGLEMGFMVRVMICIWLGLGFV